MKGSSQSIPDGTEPDVPALDPPHTHLRFPLEPHGLQSEVTAASDLFVLAHLGVPRVDSAIWSLGIGGLVQRPLRMTLGDLKALPQRTIEAFLQCAGNPVTPTVPARLIANVLWRGVDLAAVLDAAGIRPEARFVWTYGLDRGEFMGVKSGPYLKDLPIERVRVGDVLIAWELNHEPLSPEHGFPARLVVPGFYGTNSVKWLHKIELSDVRAQGPFTTTFYNDIIAGPTSEPISRPVWNVLPECVIVSPGPGEVVASAGHRSVRVWGWAWGDDGILRVDVSFDAGSTWRQAQLDPPHARSWQRFGIDWLPQGAGPVELQCRATDATGRIQPPDGARNAIHGVTVTVHGQA